jgi:hypothetical protein
MHGGAQGPGAPRGNKNALKNGLYTREAIAQRRQVSELMRPSRKLLLKIEQRTGLFPFARLSKSNAKPTAIFVEEFDSGGFKCISNCQIICSCQRVCPSAKFGAANSGEIA